jgi:glutathione-specific gamma-glutamylcyclotransferase
MGATHIDSPADPQAMQQRIQSTLDAAMVHASEAVTRGADVWVFGYASLIWQPEFAATATRGAVLPGWHRGLRMRSHVHRGTHELPGLVCALFEGGQCEGQVFRMAPDRIAEDLPRLWQREMPSAVYDPRWLPCRTAQGEDIEALAFTLHVEHPSHTGELQDDAMLHILKHACGRRGTTLDYLLDTWRGLRDVGIDDPDLTRIVDLARSAGLCCAEARSTTSKAHANGQSASRGAEASTKPSPTCAA